MARTTASWEASSGRRVQPTEEDEVEDDEKGRTSGRGNQCFNRKNWDSLRPLLPFSLWVTMVTSFQDDHS